MTTLDEEAASCRTALRRYRSVPHARKFFIAALLSFFQFIAMFMAACTIAICLITKSLTLQNILIATATMAGILWLASYLKRRKVLCSLCKGTPLLDSGARHHQHARRFFPLNYGTSAVVSVLVCQSFRCMYCGENFDLLKPGIVPRKNALRRGGKNRSTGGDPPVIPRS